jgi:predicted nucleic-acid-binding protein
MSNLTLGNSLALAIIQAAINLQELEFVFVLARGIRPEKTEIGETISLLNGLGFEVGKYEASEAEPDRRQLHIKFNPFVIQNFDVLGEAQQMD